MLSPMGYSAVEVDRRFRSEYCLHHHPDVAKDVLLVCTTIIIFVIILKQRKWIDSGKNLVKHIP
jgi:hypothetical protein